MMYLLHIRIIAVHHNPRSQDFPFAHRLSGNSFKGNCTASMSKTVALSLKEADDRMLNTYSVIAVNPEAPFADADGNPVADAVVNTAGADALIQLLAEKQAPPSLMLRE